MCSLRVIASHPNGLARSRTQVWGGHSREAACNWQGKACSSMLRRGSRRERRAGRAVPTRCKYVPVSSRLPSMATDGRHNPAAPPFLTAIAPLTVSDHQPYKCRDLASGAACLRPFDARDGINEPTGMYSRRVAGRLLPAQRQLKTQSNQDNQRAVRCRTASNRQIPAVTETLRLLTAPAMGNLAR